MPDFNLPDSLLIPTTEIYNIEELGLDNEALSNFLVQLTQTVNSIALAVNMKDTGYYVPAEIANSQNYFAASGNTLLNGEEPRPVYRKVVFWNKPLPNAGIDSLPHGIQGIDSSNPTTFRFTRIYGCATFPTLVVVAPPRRNFIPLPYSSVVSVNNNIELFADQTNVYISTGFDRTPYTSAFIVLEYVKES